MPYTFATVGRAVVNNCIYLLGMNDSNYNTLAYKYDIATNTYIKLSNVPYNFGVGIVVTIDNCIYLLGGSTSDYANYAYKYNTLTDTYTRLKDIPYKFYYGAATVAGPSIYLFGNYQNSGSTKNAYRFDVANLNNKEIYIQNKAIFKATLSKILSTYFNNAFIYDDDEIKPYPCYYGDGTKWNLIEKAS